MKILIALLLTTAITTTAAAQSLPEGVAKLRLLPGWRDGAVQHVGLEITLADGWHTYWRVPGEAGIPPLFNWGGSRNLSSVGIAWPVPDLFDQNGMTSIGYTDRVILPLALTTLDPKAPLHLEGQIEIGVCNQVCTPFSADVFGDFTPGGAVDPVLRAAFNDGPAPGKSAGVGAVTCTSTAIDDGLRVTTSITLATLGKREHVVMELPDKNVWISDADVSRDGKTLTATADMVPPSARPFALDRSTLRITVLADGRAVDIQGCTGG